MPLNTAYGTCSGLQRAKCLTRKKTCQWLKGKGCRLLTADKTPGPPVSYMYGNERKLDKQETPLKKRIRKQGSLANLNFGSLSHIVRHLDDDESMARLRSTAKGFRELVPRSLLPPGANVLLSVFQFLLDKEKETGRHVTLHVGFEHMSINMGGEPIEVEASIDYNSTKYKEDNYKVTHVTAESIDELRHSAIWKRWDTPMLVRPHAKSAMREAWPRSMIRNLKEFIDAMVYAAHVYNTMPRVQLLWFTGGQGGHYKESDFSRDKELFDELKTHYVLSPNGN